jgi:hypothetical protein
MENSKSLQLFKGVLAKTKAGRIKWERTASESDYFALLPDGVTVSISTWVEPGAIRLEEEHIAMVLLADERELLRVTPEVDGIKDELYELYELARRQALEVDAKVDKVLGVLAKL